MLMLYFLNLWDVKESVAQQTHDILSRHDLTDLLMPFHFESDHLPSLTFFLLYGKIIPQLRNILPLLAYRLRRCLMHAL